MPKLKRASAISKWYVADAKDGTNSTFRTKSGAQTYLKKHGGGKIIIV